MNHHQLELFLTITKLSITIKKKLQLYPSTIYPQQKLQQYYIYTYKSPFFFKRSYAILDCLIAACLFPTRLYSRPLSLFSFKRRHLGYSLLLPPILLLLFFMVYAFACFIHPLHKNIVVLSPTRFSCFVAMHAYHMYIYTLYI